MSFAIWKLMSLGFTCPKSEGNYGTWHQWPVNNCLHASVRETLFWVTGDPHSKKHTWTRDRAQFKQTNKQKGNFKITIYEQFPAKTATVSPWSLEDTYRAKPTWTSRPVLRGYFSVRGSCWIRGRPRLLRLLWRKETAFLAFSCRQTLALRGSVFIEPFNLLKQVSSQFFPTILIPI